MWLAAAAAAVVALYLLHRLALWLERRGWLFYLHRRSTTSAVGSVFSELHSVLDPGHRHAVEEQAREAQSQDDSGDPPDPWSRRGEP